VKNSKQLSIFVVDDEQIIATTLTLILQNSGYLAQAFFNPLQALAAARLEAPDLVISDVVMPQLTGVELAIQIRAMCPSCKVILFSGQAQTGDLLSVARAQGHNFDLLSKPVHPVDLLRYIKEHERVYN
jgi:CheY-like chemotaxis protein